MTRAALADPFRLIGMIQPTGTGDGPNGPELFRVGCAGRLISFAETDDGRYLITLDGLCRFRTGNELPVRDGYRRCEVDWSPYQADMEQRSTDRPPVQRIGIASAAEAYFRGRKMSINPEALRKLGDAELVTALSMGCPFTPEEKQALLEASDLPARAKLLETLFAMGAKEPFGDGEATRH
jgi:Lon protease-like protein